MLWIFSVVLFITYRLFTFATMILIQVEWDTDNSVLNYVAYFVAKQKLLSCVCARLNDHLYAVV